MSTLSSTNFFERIQLFHGECLFDISSSYGYPRHKYKLDELAAVVERHENASREQPGFRLISHAVQL
jgi:hypothetical protein